MTEPFKKPPRSNGTYYNFTEENLLALLDEWCVLNGGEANPEWLPDLINKYRTARYIVTDGHAG